MIDLSNYKEPRPHRVKRLLWLGVNSTIFKLLIGPPLRHVRTFLLRLFCANIPYSSSVYQSCKVYAPWNLSMGKYTCIGPNTEIYNKGKVTIGNNCVISQGAFICTAGHDITDRKNSLITGSIIIEDDAWIAADAFVGMGVTIKEGAVVGARAAVFKDVDSWTVVGGNPAKFIKKRIIEK